MENNDTISIDGLHFKKVINSTGLCKIVQEVSEKITKDLSTRQPIFLCVLKGAYIFMADLCRQFTFSHEVEFVKVRSYEGLKSGEKVHIEKLWDEGKLENRVVVIVEDIIDSGKTIKHLIQFLQNEKVQEVKTCTLLFKPEMLKEEIPINYVGKVISNEFVVGYGLDYNQKGRYLPHLYQK